MEIITPFILNLNWCDSKSNLMITSRYPFIIEENGQDQVKRFFITIPMMEFRGADLLKLQENSTVSHIAQSKNRTLYVEISKGNPRLLETLDVIAGDEKKYNIDELKARCLNREVEYIACYLTDIITQTEDPAFHTFISKASVYRIPVTKQGYMEFGNETMLEKSTALTLMEKEAVLEREPVYWINPFIRQRFLDRLEEDELLTVQKIAFDYYNICIKENKAPDISYYREAVDHGIACNKIIEAIPYAIRAAKYFNRQYVYDESLRMLKGLTDRLDGAVIKDEIHKPNFQTEIYIILYNIKS